MRRRCSRGAASASGSVVAVLVLAACSAAPADLPVDGGQGAPRTSYEASADPVPSAPADPVPSALAPLPQERPTPDAAGTGEVQGRYEYCETAPAGDPSCSTTRYGDDREAAEEFLRGPDVGPGGLVEMTATDDGFPAGSTAVGSPLHVVNATWTLQIDEPVSSDGACDLLMDQAKQIGAVVDRDGDVQAFIIVNPVVRTDAGVGAGSSLADIRAQHAVEVVPYGAGSIAYTVREDVLSHYDDVEPSRMMLFVLSADDLVEMWAVGATSYVAAIASEGPCPVP